MRAEIDIAGDVLLVNDDLCGFVRVLLYPLRSLLYRAGERCGGSRVFSGELGGDERIAAVFILVIRVGRGVDEGGQAVLLLCDGSGRVAEGDGVNRTVFEGLRQVVARVDRELDFHVLLGHADACGAQRTLGNNGRGVCQTRNADLLALEVGDALDVAVARYEQLGAAGVQAGGELDGQAVFERLEQLADEAHADIDLIRADGFGNVRRIDGYLLNVETLVLEVAVFNGDIHRRRAQRGGVNEAQMGGPAVRSAVSGGRVRAAAAAAGRERKRESTGEHAAQYTRENSVLFHG